VVAVPVNTLMNEADYRFMLEDSRACPLVGSEELYLRFENLIGSCPDLEHILVQQARLRAPLFEDALQAAVGTDCSYGVLMSEGPTPTRLLRRYGVTVFFAVPTFYAALLAANPVERAALRLRSCVSAGEALPVDVGRCWSERFGIDFPR